MSKRRKAEEERETFVKETAEKKAAERAEVVKQARSLLLQKKPLCRRINSALLASEVLSHKTNVHVIPLGSPLINLNKQNSVP